MSTHAHVEDLPFYATANQHRWLSATHVEVASVGAVPGVSTDRPRRFAWSDRLVSVEPEPQSLRAAWPVWANGTLPGIMAGERPAWQLWKNGTLSGVMAGERPAPRLVG